MQLFTRDLFKAFTFGFAFTTLAMSNFIAPGLWSDVLGGIA